MFSRSLFKQSCRANGWMWLIITVAVCFMLSCVMLISGNGDISTTKNAIQNTIIQGEITSQVQKSALNYYETSEQALEHFDTVFAQEYAKAYTAALTGGVPAEQAGQVAFASAYAAAVTELKDVYTPAVLSARGLDADSDGAKEVMGAIFYVLNPMQADGTYMYDSFYAAHGETPAHYTELLVALEAENHATERQKYVMNQSSAFLAGNLTGEAGIEKILQNLSSYGVTAEKYEEFGFSDYGTVRDIARAAVVDYRANLEYRLDNLKDGESAESVRAELVGQVSGSLLSSLPSEVSDALEEIGQMDMYGVLVGSIFFKMAGLLLPIIYMIMTANALIAGQVDSGSMAYVLSSSVRRRTVTFTQATYLISSLLAMFALTAATGLVCLSRVDVDTKLDASKLLLLSAGAFLVMFAMSGFCFLTSCYFDRSRKSMALGGGLSMFFLVATMLGLFGSPILPSIIRMDALNFFNYVSIITLFDPIAILDGSTDYLWKFAILFGAGLVCYIAGSIRFCKKDLPL